MSVFGVGLEEVDRALVVDSVSALISCLTIFILAKCLSLFCLSAFCNFSGTNSFCNFRIASQERLNSIKSALAAFLGSEFLRKVSLIKLRTKLLKSSFPGNHILHLKDN